MAKTKPIALTPKNVKALLNSPAVVKKREMAEEMFNSPQFRSHIEKQSARRRAVQGNVPKK